MASRYVIKTWIRDFLGTSADDPAFSATILDPIVQQAEDSLLASIQDANPDYLVKLVTLTADSATSHNYTFAGQAAPVTDFARWLEVRYDNEDGALLDEARLEEMREFGSDFFVITGPDEAPVLVTSKDSPAGKSLYFRYVYWPPAQVGLAFDSGQPTGIPSRFHDVVALESLFAFGLGGEQARPPELSQRWMDRRGQMLAHVSRRGIKPGRTRLLQLDDDL